MIRLFVLISLIISFSKVILVAQDDSTLYSNRSITILEASQLLIVNNNAIKISKKAQEIAKAEKAKLNSSWYPFLTAGGEYLHMSNDISAKESVETLVKQFKDAVPELNAIINKILPALNQIFPGTNIGEIISNSAKEIGAMDLVFPLMKQNVASINASITWPIFTGGKRLYASKIGSQIVNTADNLYGLTTNSQMAMLAESYYGAKLTEESVNVNREYLNAMEMLYNDALKMNKNGLLDKAGMLVAKVSYEESKTLYENAINNNQIALNALSTLINIKDPEDDEMKAHYELSSNFFKIDSLPPIDYYKEKIGENNHQLKIIENQIEIVSNEKKIAISGYMPDIALFARQNLYTYNTPKNLVPRTVIGAGFVWNLFDGTNRESSIKAASREKEQLNIQKEAALSDLYLLSEKLYTQIKDSWNNINTLETALEFGKELVRIRERSFLEGMATSTDVVYARSLYAKIRLAISAAYFAYDISLANLYAICGDTESFMAIANSN